MSKTNFTAQTETIDTIPDMLNYYYYKEIFNDKDIHQLETHQPVYGTSEAVEFELDDYQKQRLAELGLYQPPKPESDGSEFISRL